MGTAAAMHCPGSVKDQYYCWGIGKSYVARQASTSQPRDIDIKDSGHSQSIFWNYIIRSNIRPHSNVYSSRIYEAGAGESGGVQ